MYDNNIRVSSKGRIAKTLIKPAETSKSKDTSNSLESKVTSGEAGTSATEETPKTARTPTITGTRALG
jgi:hypothetical protein